MSSDDVSELSVLLTEAPVVDTKRLSFLRGGGSVGGLALFSRGRSCRAALALDVLVDTTATPTNGSLPALLEKRSISSTASLGILEGFLEV